MFNIPECTESVIPSTFWELWDDYIYIANFSEDGLMLRPNAYGKILYILAPKMELGFWNHTKLVLNNITFLQIFYFRQITLCELKQNLAMAALICLYDFRGLL
jgi:hypothetical protein